MERKGNRPSPMVEAYIRAGQLAEKFKDNPPRAMKFRSARNTLLHYMTPRERAMLEQQEKGNP